MQPRRNSLHEASAGAVAVLLAACLLHLPDGAYCLVITESEPRSAASGRPHKELLKTDKSETLTDGDIVDSGPTLVNARWLRATGDLQVDTTAGSIERTGFLAFRSWAPEAASSVHGVLKYAVNLPLMLLQPSGLSQTDSKSHPQPAASMGAVEPDIVIYSDPDVNANEKWKRLLREQAMALSAMLVSSSVTLVLAFFFWRNRKPPEREQQGGLNFEDAFKTWRHGLFTCFGDMEVCLWACFCPAIRWAGTVQLMGFMGFWMAFTICFGITLSASTTGDFAIWVVLAIVCAAMRQEMRTAYGMHRQGGWTYMEDFILYCCCACCTVIQEARQVEDAYKVGYPIVVRNEAKAPLAAHMHGIPVTQPHLHSDPPNGQGPLM